MLRQLVSSVFHLFTQQTFTELQRSDGTAGGEQGWQLAGPPDAGSAANSITGAEQASNKHGWMTYSVGQGTPDINQIIT